MAAPTPKPVAPARGKTTTGRNHSINPYGKRTLSAEESQIKNGMQKKGWHSFVTAIDEYGLNYDKLLVIQTPMSAIDPLERPLRRQALQMQPTTGYGKSPYTDEWVFITQVGDASYGPHILTVRQGGSERELERFAQVFNAAVNAEALYHTYRARGDQRYRRPTGKPNPQHYETLKEAEQTLIARGKVDATLVESMWKKTSGREALPSEVGFGTAEPKIPGVNAPSAGETTTAAVKPGAQRDAGTSETFDFIASSRAASPEDAGGSHVLWGKVTVRDNLHGGWEMVSASQPQRFADGSQIHAFNGAIPMGQTKPDAHQRAKVMKLVERIGELSGQNPVKLPLPTGRPNALTFEQTVSALQSEVSYFEAAKAKPAVTAKTTPTKGWETIKRENDGVTGISYRVQRSVSSDGTVRHQLVSEQFSGFIPLNVEKLSPYISWERDMIDKVAIIGHITDKRVDLEPLLISNRDTITPEQVSAKLQKHIDALYAQKTNTVDYPHIATGQLLGRMRRWGHVRITPRLDARGWDMTSGNGPHTFEGTIRLNVQHYSETLVYEVMKRVERIADLKNENPVKLNLFAMEYRTPSELLAEFDKDIAKLEAEKGITRTPTAQPSTAIHKGTHKEERYTDSKGTHWDYFVTAVTERDPVTKMQRFEITIEPDGKIAGEGGVGGAIPLNLYAQDYPSLQYRERLMKSVAGYIHAYAKAHKTSTIQLLDFSKEVDALQPAKIPDRYADATKALKAQAATKGWVKRGDMLVPEGWMLHHKLFGNSALVIEQMHSGRDLFGVVILHRGNDGEHVPFFAPVNLVSGKELADTNAKAISSQLHQLAALADKIPGYLWPDYVDNSLFSAVTKDLEARIKAAEKKVKQLEGNKPKPRRTSDLGTIDFASLDLSGITSTRMEATAANSEAHTAPATPAAQRQLETAVYVG